MLTQGNCPKCGSTDLSYDTVDLEGEQAVFPFVCNDCGFIGNEICDLDFVGFTDENGDEVDDG